MATVCSLITEQLGRGEGRTENGERRTENGVPIN